MASVESQLPACPICKQSDQVKTMQAAYDSGVGRCVPPEMPTRNISMMKYILGGGLILGICIFLVIVLIGSEADLGTIGELALVTVTFVCLVSVLAISYVAFQRVVHGDNEATLQFPAWDRAMKTWSGLDYCARDTVVFDPETNSTVSDKQLALLRTLNPEQAAIESASIAG